MPRTGCKLSLDNSLNLMQLQEHKQFRKEQMIWSNGERDQRKRLMQFLMGLDECYSNVRGQILLMQPLPITAKTYGMVRQEEKQRESFMPKSTTITSAALSTYSRHPLHGKFPVQNKTYSTSTQPAKKVNMVMENENYNNTDLAVEARMDQLQNQLNQVLIMFQATQQNSENDAWIVDSGATDHVSTSLSYMHNIQTYDTPILVTLPNGHNTSVTTYGSVTINLNIILHEDHNKQIAHGTLSNGVYIITQDKSTHNSSINHTFTTSSNTNDESSLWHSRLGHPSIHVMKCVKDIPSVIKCNNTISTCTICPLSKQNALPFPISSSHAKSLFALIHIDVWGPHKYCTMNNCRYFLTIMDDHSRATWTYIIPNKHHVTTQIKTFYAYILNQFSISIKTIRTDNGTEFINESLTTFFNQHGITHQTSCPYTPQQNARVERKHRQLLEVARALRFQSHIPIHFWGYYKFAPRSIPSVLLGYPLTQKGYILYNLETHKVFVTRDVTFNESIFTFKQLTTQPSNSEHFNPDILATDNTSTTYQTNTITPTMPTTTPTINTPSTNTLTEPQNQQPNTEHTTEDNHSPQQTEPQNNVTSSQQNTQTTTSNNTTTRKSSRTHNPPTKLKDYHYKLPQANINSISKFHYSKYINYTNILNKPTRKLIFSINTSVEPYTYNQASKNEKWREAMNTELKALESNNT
ncbi:uncharacterized protein [Rutidosis leptorrhynchoides]|uniref:uncharacterized protein n=1 Tax=Rutidosis leptorrhynchoides TaxID=125765 RepID=UPI003A98ECD9